MYSLISPATSRCRITTLHGDSVQLLYAVRALYIGVSTATASFSFRSCQFMTIGTTFRIHLSVSTASQKRFWALHPLRDLWVEKLGPPQSPLKCGFFGAVRPLRGRRERDSGGPFTLSPRQRSPETPPGALPLDSTSKKPIPERPQTPAKDCVLCTPAFP